MFDIYLMVIRDNIFSEIKNILCFQTLDGVLNEALQRAKKIEYEWLYEDLDTDGLEELYDGTFDRKFKKDFINSLKTWHEWSIYEEFYVLAKDFTD